MQIKDLNLHEKMLYSIIKIKYQNILNLKSLQIENKKLCEKQIGIKSLHHLNKLRFLYIFF